MEIEMVNAIKEYYNQEESLRNAKNIFGENHPIIKDESAALDEKWQHLCNIAEFLYGEVK